MWDSILDIYKSATAFLQNSKAPPNTSPALKQAMEDENHFSSKKFFIIFSSVLLLAFVYYSTIAILFFLPITASAHISAFVSIFSDCMKVFGLIIASYLGVQTIADFSFNSASNTNLQSILDTQNSTEIQHIIEEGTSGAPDVRPYSTNAIDE
jgi:hypothetical protein